MGSSKNLLMETSTLRPCGEGRGGEEGKRGEEERRRRGVGEEEREGEGKEGGGGEEKRVKERKWRGLPIDWDHG